MIRVDVALKLGAFDLDVAFENDVGITALFGRSGSGKSMTINLIAGLARPDRGSIVLDGRVLVDTEAAIFVPTIAAGSGSCSRMPSSFPHLSVQAKSPVRPLVRAEDRAEGRLRPRGRDARHRASAQAQAGAAVGRRKATGGDRPGAACLA